MEAVAVLFSALLAAPALATVSSAASGKEGEAEREEAARNVFRGSDFDRIYLFNMQENKAGDISYCKSALCRKAGASRQPPKMSTLDLVTPKSDRFITLECEQDKVSKTHVQGAMGTSRLALQHVPWTSPSEWDAVYEGLFASQGVHDALGTVSVWRVRGSVPAPVEATYTLLLLRTHPLQDEHVQRLSLAMALIRFVNDMVDPEQQAARALPITQIADRLRLPRLLIDLRHEGTHDRLPALDALRVASNVALDWLRENYWESTAWERLLAEQTIEQKLDWLVRQGNPCEDNDKSRERLLAKTLNEIPHLQMSPDLQRLFCKALLQRATSMAAHSLLHDTVAILIRWAPRSFPVVLLQALFEHGLATHLLEQAAAAVQDSDCLARVIPCIARHYLRHSDPAPAQTIRSRLAFTPTHALGVLLRLYANEAVAANSIRKRPAAQPHGDSLWQRDVHWRPCPLGCTPTYNPRADAAALT